MSHDSKAVPAFAYKHTKLFQCFAEKSQRPLHMLSIHEPEVKFGKYENQESPERMTLL